MKQNSIVRFGGIISRNIRSFGCSICKLIPKRVREEVWLCQDNQRPPVDKYFADRDLDTFDKIQKKLKSVSTPEEIQEVLSYCKYLYDEEDRRQNLLDSKATVLAGFCGTSIAGILAFLVLLIDSARFTEFRIVPIGLSVLILLFLIVCVFFCVRTLKLWTYDSPLARSIFDISRKTIQNLHKHRASAYFSSYVQNHSVNNRRANNYKYAINFFQFSFLISIPLLISLIFSVNLDKSSSIPIHSPTSTLTSTLTVTVPPTQTASDTSTPRPSIIPSSTPTDTPKPTSTLTPTTVVPTFSSPQTNP